VDLATAPLRSQSANYSSQLRCLTPVVEAQPPHTEWSGKTLADLLLLAERARIELEPFPVRALSRRL